MKSRNSLPISAAFCVLALFIPLMHGADEAERQVWEFKTQAAAWAGNGPLKLTLPRLGWINRAGGGESNFCYEVGQA